jgi:hypothetical protein
MNKYSHVFNYSGCRHSRDLQEEDELVWQGNNSEFPVFDFDQILLATNNFSEENKLGQGGFGAVCKVDSFQHTNHKSHGREWRTGTVRLSGYDRSTVIM